MFLFQRVRAECPDIPNEIVDWALFYSAVEPANLKSFLAQFPFVSEEAFVELVLDLISEQCHFQQERCPGCLVSLSFVAISDLIRLVKRCFFAFSK